MQDYEDAIKRIGRPGWFHLFLGFAGGCVAMKNSFTIIGYLFVVGRTKYKCDWLHVLERTNQTSSFCFENANGSLVCDLPNQCAAKNGSIVTRCDKWIYDRSVFENTAFMEFNMVCGRHLFYEWSNSVIWIGLVFGVFFGPIADRYGRRVGTIIGFMVDTICSVVLIFVPEVWSFLFFRMLLGFAISAMRVPFILMQETVYCRYRGLTGNFFWFSWVSGYCLCALCGYFLRNWRHFQIAAALSCIPFMILLLFLPESPRWLLLRGRKGAAQKVLNCMSRMNRVPKIDVFNVECHATEKHGTIRDLWRTPVMRMKTIILMLEWLITALTYYGISLNSGFAFKDNVYLTVILMGLCELPAYFIGAPFSEYIGRRNSIFTFLSSSAALLLVLPFLPASIGWLVPVFAGVGKIVVTSAFTIVVLYTTELYPTGLRNIGSLTPNAVSQISGFIVPYINHMQVWAYYSPYIIYAVAAIIGAALILVLPETSGYALPQTIEEADKFVRGKEYLSAIKQLDLDEADDADETSPPANEETTDLDDPENTNEAASLKI